MLPSKCYASLNQKLWPITVGSSYFAKSHLFNKNKNKIIMSFFPSYENNTVQNNMDDSTLISSQ